MNHICRAAKDIDDSVAMLLEYAEKLNVAPRASTNLHYPLNKELQIKVSV